MDNKTIITLEQQHTILYEILYMVDDFCKAHEIQYFLIGGSLLGAVRHHGIIPWDDDIDIAMTRENYEKFLKLFTQNTPDGYELYNFYTTYWFDSPIIKVAKANTMVKETFFYHAKMGINIDILPYDGCGNGIEEAKRYFQKTNSPILHKAFCFGSNPKYTCPNWKSKLLYYSKIYPLLFFPKIKKRYLDRFYRKALKYSIEDCSHCACIVNGLYGYGEVRPITFVKKLTTLPFGEKELPVPSDWETYLTEIYGDYMTPPPIEKRKRHSTEPACIIQK